MKPSPEPAEAPVDALSDPSDAIPPDTPDAAMSAAPVIAMVGTTTPKPWLVYLIECQDGSIYTGIAVDVAARYAQHRAGKGARYTRSHPPQRLLAVIPQPDRSSALKIEHAIKQWPVARKRSLALLHPPAAGLLADCASSE